MENGKKMTPQTETNSNASSSSNSTPTQRKAQHCTRCYYHGVTAPLKGHKKDCKHRDCMCIRCVLVTARKEVARQQVALGRALKQDAKKVKRPEEVDPQPFSFDADRVFSILQSVASHGGSCDSGRGDSPISNLSSDSYSDVGGATRVTNSRTLPSLRPYSRKRKRTSDYAPQIQTVTPTSPSPLPSRSLVASCDSSRGDSPISDHNSDLHSDVSGTTSVSTSYNGITINHVPQMQIGTYDTEPSALFFKVNPTSPGPQPPRKRRLVSSCDSSRGDSPISDHNSDLHSDVSGTTSVSTSYNGITINHVPQMPTVNPTSPGPQPPRKRRLVSSCDSGRGDSPISDLNSDLHSDVGDATRVSSSYSRITNNHVPQMQTVPDSSEYNKILLQYNTMLMESFRNSWPSLVPKFYNLKCARANLEEAAISKANEDICKLNFMKSVRMLQSGWSHCYPGVYTALPTEAPTYEGQVPWIGVTPTYESQVPHVRVAPPPNFFFQWPDHYAHTHAMGTHTPAAGIPPSPESIPEDSTSQSRSISDWSMK
ncbi:uncharacterized protein LOC143423154 isoform X2 [Xylocopa sonorina]|uniref:uncharacterized protein LOC143423154 isoform X2 n=1 Tax=Xylocopa sonorina TaxID=1818115 RepID=UPI00403AE694